jgi:class 3 adenylate cyclase
MFCDLVGSTALSNAMGPEHLAVLVTTLVGTSPPVVRLDKVNICLFG